MATILVTDGEQRAALAVVRSLGRAGHTVVVTAERARSLAGQSRYAAAQEPVPDPLASPEQYASALAGIVAQRGVQVVLPITDASLLAALRARTRFGSAAIPFPDLDRVRLVNDKALLMSRAPEAGIAVPRQLVLETAAQRSPLPQAELRFPLVIKPSRSVTSGTQGRLTKLGVLHAANASELNRALETLPSEAYPVLLQQRISGPGVGVFLLVWHGETKAVFSHRRIREKPPSGGVSVYRESIPADPALVARSRALLDMFGWSGVAMIEYKLDDRDGTPYLMEINGRFWGSLQLAVDAGVDFPALLVKLALGEPVAPVTSYRTGIRSRWWWGDVDHLLARLLRSDARLSLPPGSPGKLATLASFAVPWRPGDRNEIFRWNDPRPFFWETMQWLQGR